MKKCFKNRCCVYKPDRLARANTWSLERPDTRNPRSSEGKRARAKNTMHQVANPGARSSDRILARAKEISLERRNTALRPILDAISRSSEYNLARATRHKTTLARATKSSLERTTQKLDSNTWFTNPTNLKQTCPTQI